MSGDGIRRERSRTSANVVNGRWGEQRNSHFLHDHAEDWLGDRDWRGQHPPDPIGHDRIAQRFVERVLPILTGF